MSRMLLLCIALWMGAALPSGAQTSTQTTSGTTDTQQGEHVLVIGDSLLDWHRIKGTAIPQVLARRTGWTVRSRALSGAAMTLSRGDQVQSNPRRAITAQYVPGAWDWVVINGGANDLLTKCGCSKCAQVLGGLISPDGSAGIIPDLVRQARQGGAAVVMVGYLGNPRRNLFSRCHDAVHEMARRQMLFAKQDRDVLYFSSNQLIDTRLRSSFAFDGVHPSQNSARIIATSLAEVMRSHKPHR